MNKERNKYQSPLSARYASDEMLYIFSEDFKFTTWRSLWIALAECQKKLGLKITDEQIKELKKFKDNINYAEAEEIESKTRHDVMAHVKAYGLQCKKAAGIIHLGATSAYVGDNTDLIQLKKASELLLFKISSVIKSMSAFAIKHANTPTLGYTHFQSAQPVTVGKRAALWIQDLLTDFLDLKEFCENLKFLGVKGTTGTQASFVKLFNGNTTKILKLDEIITKSMGFKESFPVTGQTYPRKVDAKILAILSGVAQSAHKFASDLRLLMNIGEMEEPFGKSQIGSSAMAYKRNPMRSERICSLARFVMSLSNSTAFTASTQWFERTLDDSANKRMAIPEAFLSIDAILSIYQNIADGIVVNKHVIDSRLKNEIPFMVTENILMEAVKKGADRQLLHEKIRVYSVEAKRKMLLGEACDLFQNILADKDFKLKSEDIKKLSEPKNLIGIADIQTKNFIKNTVLKTIKNFASFAPTKKDLKV